MSGAGGRSNGYDDPRRWSEAKVKAKEDFGRSRRGMERLHAGGMESRAAANGKAHHCQAALRGGRSSLPVDSIVRLGKTV